MRQEDINELINEARENLEKLKTYRNISRPTVKSTMEHLRSCLEYAAQDISTKIEKPNTRPYFPYADNQTDLDKNIQKRLPNLKMERPDIYVEIVNLHNFINNNKWLKNLCDLTNGVKHHKAIDVNTDEVVNINVDGVPFMRVSNSTVRVNGAKINGKKIDDFVIKNDEIHITKKGEIPINFRITRDRKIIKGGIEVDLIGFLEECIDKIDDFIKSLYKKL